LPGIAISSWFIVARISAAVRGIGQTRNSSMTPFHVSRPGTLESPLPIRRMPPLFRISVATPSVRCAHLRAVLEQRHLLAVVGGGEGA